MKRLLLTISWLFASLCVMNLRANDLLKRFESPDNEASPWIFWYWMNGAVTEEGITADLEAMKAIGLEGAYLMPIRDSSRVQFMENSVLQATPRWWKMVEHSMREADRLGLQLGLHISDGFALAGGPWIRPDQSMQKVVSASCVVSGGTYDRLPLPQPEIRENHYRDIAVFALPLNDSAVSSMELRPKVSCSLDLPVEGLLDGSGKLKTKQACWVQYEFDQAFTARSLTIRPSGTNFQALRWTVMASQDGVRFELIKQTQPARRGWQDTDAPSTYSLPETTARFFRFYWTPEGTEPGAEDLDAAKWKAELSVRQLTLNSLPLIENYEGKTGLVWRLSPSLTSKDLDPDQCFQRQDMVPLTHLLQADGSLKNCSLDANRRWLILRLGHTSTGHRNETGGGAKGLECDKFNPEAVQTQFDHWFGAAYRCIDSALVSRVLTRMHSDSWECGSQNWTPRFLEEFKARRGYDLLPFLPLFAGLPLESAEVSEAVLYDIRLTIVELTNDVFFAQLKQLAHRHGCEFSSECVAPTMLSDGLRHYQHSDLPMGEFWLDSPTHDKPNDLFDAVSGAHIYGKNIVQAEGFTQLRALWKEYPGQLKTLGDFNLAFGMNRLFFHVYCHHPFPDKYPGMTLDGIGLYMHGSQTWWPYAGAWTDYLSRCQSLLQFGHPVRDIAVFTGENLPSRALLPDKLVASLPGLFGQEQVAREAARVSNVGQPMHNTSVGVTASANMVTANQWYDPLRGYQYDAINADALLRLATVENQQLCLPGGSRYRALVFPIPHALSPDAHRMSVSLLRKIRDLQQAGVVVMLPPQRPESPYSYGEQLATDSSDYAQLVQSVWDEAAARSCLLPYLTDDLLPHAIARDFECFEQGQRADSVVWSHRAEGDTQLWFVSNQADRCRALQVSLGSSLGHYECWNPQTGERQGLSPQSLGQRTHLTIHLDRNASAFVVKLPTPSLSNASTEPATIVSERDLPVRSWEVYFERLDTTLHRVRQLFDWKEASQPSIRYYSGTAVYSADFFHPTPSPQQKIYLKLDQVKVVARVRLNGQDCGVVWTPPYLVDVTHALQKGRNRLEISVANTWYNYTQAYNYGLIQDEHYWTNGRTWDHDDSLDAPQHLEPSGLFGPIELVTIQE